jgi:hypothetical protein
MQPKTKPVEPHASIPITKCKPYAHGPTWKPEPNTAELLRALRNLKVADFKERSALTR